MTCIKFKLNKMKIPEQNKVHNKRIVADYKSQFINGRFQITIYKSQIINRNCPSKSLTQTFEFLF